MARNLSEVLHYFIPTDRSGQQAPKPPEPEPVAQTPQGIATNLLVSTEPGEKTFAPESEESGLLPIVAVPVGDHDVVRAAFVWNLAVEVARLGGRARVLTPDQGDPSPLWPEPGTGPLGTELTPVSADDLGSLCNRAMDAAIPRPGDSTQGGIVFVRIPPSWLLKAGQGGALLRWTLLFSCSRGNDLKEAYGLSKLIFSAQPHARVGVTIHGAQNRREAESAFGRLARASEESLDHSLTSYGLLVDDLHVYRAIVAKRPIGLAHPQAPAALALRDVARLLLQDARAWISNDA